MNTEKMTPWRRFMGLLELDRKDIKQVFYYAIFAGLVALSLPLGIQAIINLIQGAQVSTSWILLVVLVTVGVAFQGLLQLMQIRILENVQQKIFTRSSFEFAYRFPKIRMSELHNFYPPELANRFFDTLTVQKGLSKVLIDFPAALLQIIFGLILLSFYHPFFILYGFLLLILIYSLFKLTAKKGLDTSLLESKNKYKVAHWIQEIARSLISFKLSGKTHLAMSRNDKLTTKYLSARQEHFEVIQLQFILMIGFKILVTAGLLVIGGLLVLNQQMNIGQFVASEIIILLVIASVEKLISGLETFYDLLTSLEKIGQVVDKKLELQSGPEVFSDEQNLKIELNDLKYSSPDGQEILKGIDLTINSKDKILLDGASRSGKTTLLKILSKLIEPTSGSFFINDMTAKGIWSNSYRAHIGQLLPNQMPFEGSIIDNITFGQKDVSDEHINTVLKNVGLLEFIKEQPKGLYTILYPEGQQIPYTISKRIILARAIIHNPKLLILKDPLEYLEKDETKRIIDYLMSPEHNWAIIIASKNTLWKDKCNRIITISEGQIITKNEKNA